eukprot:1158960-Pelagomonas_calceolata.AAC.10
MRDKPTLTITESRDEPTLSKLTEIREEPTLSKLTQIRDEPRFRWASHQDQSLSQLSHELAGLLIRQGPRQCHHNHAGLQVHVRQSI